MLSIRLLFPFLFVLGAAVASAQTVRLNEILAANSNVLADPAGGFDDWVEICNPGPDPVQLAGFFLSDQAGFPAKWLIPATDPAATLIPPQGFLLLWLDAQPDQGPDHAPFKLDAAGESLWLTAPDGITLLDSVLFGPQAQNISLGRLPDVTGDWALCATPTPLGLNAGVAQLPVCSAPSASIEGGFFTKPFPLALTCDVPNSQIRLSFDGSLPDESDSLYTQPIDLQQTTVVRARCFATGFLPGKATTNTYFFTAPHSFPVVSLVFEPLDFFDSTSGIYHNWQTMAEVERPLHAEWFEPDGARGFSLDLGVELFGSGSLALPQKSLLLKAKSDFGAHDIDYPVFADLPYDKYRRLVLRNSGQDWCVSQFRDALVTDLVRHTADQAPVLERTHLTVQGFQPAVVYFNGAYQGIFNVREHLGADFLRHHFDLDEDEADLIDFYGNALTGDSIAWFEFWNWLNANHFHEQQNFELLRQKTDLDNFADYCILEIISDNVDWPTKNWRRMRPRTPEGRWYWLPYDFDLSFGLFSLDGQWNSGFAGQNAFARALDSTSMTWPNPDWSTLPLRRALENDGFRYYFLNRTADFLNTVFLPSRVQERIDQFENLYLPEIEGHFGFWFQSPGWVPYWLENVQKMRDFSQQRPAFCYNHVLETFPNDVNGLATVSLAAEPPEGGQLLFSTLHFDAVHLPWSGVYFQGVPIPVRAEANPGWHFEGWSAPEAGESDSTSLVLSGDLQLTAFFVQDSMPVSGLYDAARVSCRLSPNPASEYLDIQANKEIFQLLLLDAAGKTLVQQEAGSRVWRCDIRHLPAGWYGVQVIFRDGCCTSSSFIKN